MFTTLLQPSTALARLLGLGICLFSTWFSAWAAVDILTVIRPPVPWWACLIALPCLGLAVWGFTSLGEWLWSFAGGWRSLQLFLRFLQFAFILGPIAFVLIVRVAHVLHLI